MEKWVVGEGSRRREIGGIKTLAEKWVVGEEREIEERGKSDGV